ncbi:thioredoxin family protein [Tundrisphaera lichenicola]|uniref:thioredoxin family protein n=1 Tax=Tundrisphaera lichenicola TaxID=2029860 RepID=UPI003EBC4764
MTKIHALAWLGLCLAWGSTILAGVDEGLFRDLTPDRARQAAAEAGKNLVLIDFYTVWCGPCKKLDETTWKDQGVRDWLAREGICLKIDAEKEEALAEKYRINVYPTVLLLRPDGTEVDRLVGYRDAKTFLADATEAMAGNDSLSRARAKLQGENANDPMLRMNYGDALAQKDRPEDALSEYLWCFDHGLEHSRGFTGVRLSFLLGKILQLAKANPAALDELRKRRDAAGQAIEAGKADFDQAMSFTALNSNLREPDRTLVLFDRIKGDRSKPELIRNYLFDQSLDPLLKAKRYKEIVEEVDPRAKIRESIEQYQRNMTFVPKDKSLRDYMKQRVSVEGAKYYEALLGTGNPTSAAEIAAILTNFDPIGAYKPLIAAARSADDAQAAEALSKAARNPAGPEIPKESP